MEIHEGVLALLAIAVIIVRTAMAAAEGLVAVVQPAYFHHPELLVATRAPICLLAESARGRSGTKGTTDMLSASQYVACDRLCCPGVYFAYVRTPCVCLYDREERSSTLLRRSNIDLFVGLTCTAPSHQTVILNLPIRNFCGDRQERPR